MAGLEGVVWDGERMEIDDHRIGIKQIFKPQALLDWMERETVAHAWISAPPPTYRQQLGGDAARLWCAYLNDGMAEIAASSGDRLTALPHLPTQAPDVAAEIAREHAAQGATRFSMPSGTGDARGISEPEFSGLWSALEEIGATVFFHPGECADGRLKAFYLGNLVGNPHESAVAISHLVLGGILDRHPHITPCFAHGGGAYPMVADRLQRGFDTARPGVNTDGSPPKALLSRIYADCICHGEAPLVLAEETFGVTNIVFGSDWPFPMGLVEPHAQLANFDTRRRARILTDNADKLRASAGRKDLP